MVSNIKDAVRIEYKSGVWRLKCVATKYKSRNRNGYQFYWNIIYTNNIDESHAVKLHHSGIEKKWNIEIKLEPS